MVPQKEKRREMMKGGVRILFRYLWKHSISHVYNTTVHLKWVYFIACQLCFNTAEIK